MKHEKCWIYTYMYKLGKLLPEIYSKEIGKHICMYVHILFFVKCIIIILYLLLITLLLSEDIWENFLLLLLTVIPSWNKEITYIKQPTTITQIQNMNFKLNIKHINKIQNLLVT